MSFRVHPTADVAEGATIGDGTSIWQHVQIREHASIGDQCIIAKGVYIDAGVIIGSRVKIQNYVSIFHGVTIEDGVFVGPHVCFTNDMHPRAINRDGTIKSTDDWVVSNTLIRSGAALGANSTIVCGRTVGRWALVGAGSVVTRDVPDYGLVVGNPARLRGFVCFCGSHLTEHSLNPGESTDEVLLRCSTCNAVIPISLRDYKLVEEAG